MRTIFTKWSRSNNGPEPESIREYAGLKASLFSFLRLASHILNKMRSAQFRRSVIASRGLFTSKPSAGKVEADASKIQSVCERFSGVARKTSLHPPFRISAGSSSRVLGNADCLGYERALHVFSRVSAARQLTTSVANPPVERGRAQDPYLATEIALDAVVKIFAVSSSPNYFLPWQNKAQREASGSGEFLRVFVGFMIQPIKFSSMQYESGRLWTYLRIIVTSFYLDFEDHNRTKWGKQ